jgi:uncharacterized membrane protein YhhN
MLVANRLLPESLAQRADWEVWLFFGTWLSATLHSLFAVYRSAEHRAPWRALCAAIACLGLAAPLLNGVTTGDYLWHSLGQSQWAVVGVDGALLLVAWLAGSAWLLSARRQARVLPVEALEDA